ncbi:uncharacterized protein LOC130429852 [Triplophysa dalaica]|uniref:uncharacterized protein LOC130429852 n=1 Tax=Triplophysa dalaica TaxID=1582913 RepID=UPI0024E02A5E|nr:uncharacterized protein LOC130429852 [Triplophysa dalaica]
MDSKANLRYEAGELMLRASKKASVMEKLHKAQVSKGVSFVPKDPEAVLGEAKVRVVDAGGDPLDQLVLVGQSVVQFGQYRGKTFKWLLENDIGYSLMVLSAHQRESEAERLNRGALIENKDAFLQYACSFSDVTEAIRLRRQREGTLPGFEGECQSIHSQPVTAREEEPMDADLLASAMQLEGKVLQSLAPTPISSALLVHWTTQRQASAPSEVVLPESWKRSLPKEQHSWIVRALFRQRGGKTVLTEDLQMWWYPPQPHLQYHQPPASPDTFFTWPLCLWMPYRMWSCNLICSAPTCKRLGHRLTSCGLYKTVRRVLNLYSWYFLATEYLECQRCHKKVAAWSFDVLDQLDPAHRGMFPAILTYRLSCDMHVVKLMRERSLGNSVTMLHNTLHEQHSEDWMQRSMQYLTVCDQFQGSTRPITPPPMPPVPSARWLLYVHAEDVRSRYEELKARVTSVFGSILKMDSTKKVTKKLAGAAAGTAAWVTNVGNEHGQILMSVLTSHEGQGLLPMTIGLVNRYKSAGVPPPHVLYLDRDCCSAMGTSRAGAMFVGWDDLVVRLDVWHFLRRFAAGLHTDSHPLYGLFMAKLSACIFEWDEGDVALLKEAKRRELEQCQGVTGLTDELLMRKLNPKQLAKHCRRRTRGTEVTERLIGETLEGFKDAKETMGIPLMDQERMTVVWETQRRHLPCIQDPPGVQMYTQTGSVTKGGVTLPVYRCARGSTSLKSFHNHVNRFIPGTSANLENFQAFLLEGLERWNEDRAAAAVSDAPQSLRCYSASFQHCLNELSQRLLGCSLVKDYSKPGEYTGELMGVEYLCSQQSWEFRENFGRDPDTPDSIPDTSEEAEDGGFADEEEEQDLTVSTLSLVSTKVSLDLQPFSQDPPLDPQTQDVCRGPDGAPGFERVVELARYLVELREKPCLSDREAAVIIQLWDRLPDSDKQGLSYTSRHKDKVLQGTFKATHSKNKSCHGEESLKRCVPGQGSGSAQWPTVSRIVEAVCLELCSINPAGRIKWGVTMNRWSAILYDYQAIRRLVGNCPTLKGKTRIQLFEVNQRTLSVWYNDYRKKMEPNVLSLSLPLPQMSMMSHTPLPVARQKHSGTLGAETAIRPYHFVVNPDKSNQATRRGQRPPHPAAAPLSTPSAAPLSTPSAAPLSAPSAAPLSAPPAAPLSTPPAAPLSTPPAAPLSTPPAAPLSTPPAAPLSTPPAAPLSTPPAAPLSTPPAAPLSTPPAAPLSTPPAAPLSAAGNSPLKALSRSTLWRKRKAAESLAREQGLHMPEQQARKHYTCRQCGQLRRREFGHARIGGTFFCATTEGKTVEDWLKEMRNEGNPPPLI